MKRFEVIDGGLSPGGCRRETDRAGDDPPSRPWWKSCLAYYGLDDPRNLAFIAAIAAAWYFWAH